VKPYFESDGIALYNDDCRAVLPELPAGSVHLVITSPPYWALRKYAGVEPSVWDEPADVCQHKWGDEMLRTSSPQQDVGPNGIGTAGTRGQQSSAKRTAFTVGSGAFCRLCGAWRGTLGNEPTPDLYLRHLVGIFGLVRRVLRDDGVLVVNMGDSYAKGGSGDGAFGHQNAAHIAYQVNTRRTPTPMGMKPKNLLLIPFRLAMALQADGWIVRSVMPWVKRNCLPESVTDRPTNACEYLFLLSKSQRYHWDAEAVRRPPLEPWRSDGSLEQMGSKSLDAGVNGGFGLHGSEPIRRQYNPAGRNYRNSDAFFDSLDIVQRGGGLLLDADGDPMALQVNPLPLKAAHFAAYPPKLVEPFVLAAASDRTCSVCGMAWERVTERKLIPQYESRHGGFNARGNANGMVDLSQSWKPGSLDVHTLGFRCACAHADAPTVPATVMDIFSGAGTSILVAQRLGRRGIGIEVSEEYAAITKERLKVGLPMDELAAEDEPEQLAFEEAQP
jgi:DNA modification methylase